jgi:hypothetical protein
MLNGDILHELHLGLPYLLPGARAQADGPEPGTRTLKTHAPHPATAGPNEEGLILPLTRPQQPRR